jgi:ribosomal protein S18
MSFFASGSRSIARTITSTGPSASRHVSSSAYALNKISRPSGSTPAPYTPEDNQGILAMNEILRKSVLERSSSAGSRDGSQQGASSGEFTQATVLLYRCLQVVLIHLRDCLSAPSTPIQTFSPNQLYDPIDLHKSKLFPVARRGAKPPLLGPPAPIAKRSDPFYILDVNPIEEATNHRLVSAYVTQMGKIKTRAETGLTWKNQRRVGKMVRRARAMGLISRWDNNLSRASS